MRLAALVLLVPSIALGERPPATPATSGGTSGASAPTAARFNPDKVAPYFEAGPAAEAKRLLRAQDFPAALRLFDAYLKPRSAAAAGGVKDQPQAAFLAAFAAYKAGRHLDAAARLDALAASYPLLGDYHRLYAGRAYLLGGKADLALTRAGAVDKASPLDAEARLVRADALREQGKWAAAEETYRGYLTAYPASWREPEVRYRIGEAIEARLAETGPARAAEAIAEYRRIHVRFPTESWARSAEARLSALGKGTLTLKGPEHLDRGLALFEQMRNAESEAALSAALAAGDLAASQQCVAAYHRAQSVFKARERPRAAALFDEAEARCAAAAGDAKKAAAADKNAAAAALAEADDLHAKALYQGARCHAARQSFGAALARFSRIESEHAAHSYADDARLRIGEIYSDLIDKLGGRPLLLGGADAAPAPATITLTPDEEKLLLSDLLGGKKPPSLADKIMRLHRTQRSILGDIAERYPAGDQGGEALFRLAFDALRRRALDDARRSLETELAKFPREPGWWEAGRTLYWLGRVAALQQKPDEARAYYVRAAREYPLSYYALQALSRLREDAPAEAKKLIASLRAPAAKEADLAWRFQPSPIFEGAAFRRGVELARLGLGAEAKRELSFAGIRAAERRGPRPEGAAAEELQWLAAVLYDRAGEFSLSHAIPRYVLTEYEKSWPTGDNTRRWRLSYPRGYEELIAPHARRNGQPIALQFAIVREESAFNPSDESFANAIGLTQLTMAPAKRFAQGLPFTREALKDPVINVTIGARELGDVWKKAKGLPAFAIAAYNAGEGAVRRWCRNAAPGTSLDEWIELIPYDETRGYTKRVLASYFAYRWLWNDDEADLVPPLPPTILPTY